MWVQQRDYVAVGAILAAVRKRAGITQRRLASLLRKPQSFVSSFERGQRRIDLLEFLRIVDAIGADPTRVFRQVLRNQGRAR